MIFIGLAFASYGQQLNPKGLYIGKVLPINPYSMIQRVDSLIMDNMANPTKYAIIHGGDTINPAFNAAGQTEGIALADSTGLSEGNYMTRQNYHNDAGNANNLKAYKLFGTTIKAMPVVNEYAYNGLAMTDRRAYWLLCYLAEPATLTGIRFNVSTAGAFTPDQYNGFGLYSVSGTTYTRVAFTDTCALAFKSTGAKSVPFANAVGGAATPYAAQAGLYYIVVLYNNSAQVTAPSIHGTSVNEALNSSFPDSKEIAGYVNTQDVLPDSEVAGDITLFVTTWYGVIY